MMKSDCQLNHALKMPPMLSVTCGAPDVLKNFMRVKKVSAIKKIEAPVEVRAVIVGPHRHLELCFSPCAASHAVLPNIPHHPIVRTMPAITVSYGSTPSPEKIVFQSCSA